MQALEISPAFIVSADDLAIEDGIVLKARSLFYDPRIAVGPIRSVHRIQAYSGSPHVHM